MLRKTSFIIISIFILLFCGVFIGNAHAVVDTDGDDIYDDGDGSGIVGDAPCTGGNTLACDDNCINVYNPNQADLDGDGVGDACEDNAMDFSSGGHVEVTGGDLPDIANKELTVEAWVKGSTSDTTGSIFSLSSGEFLYTGTARGMHLWVKDGVPKFGVTAHPTSSPDRVKGLGTILADAWYHIAGVLTNTVHTHTESDSCSAAVMAETPHMDIYVNGEFNNCATTESLFTVPLDSPDVRIGKIGYSIISDVLPIDWRNPEIQELNVFEGEIDEIRFWTVARTEAEIQQCMNYEMGTVAGCEIDPLELKGYWRLDEGVGTAVTDSSGNGYSGDIVGSGVWVEGYQFLDINTDGDGDGYTALQGDCNDSDNLIYPGAQEICDGKDNDCNISTNDGSVEIWIGNSCDGVDSDLCAEGVYECSGGVQSCTDDTYDDIEVCDGVDNDCDGVTDNLLQTTNCGEGQCSGNTGVEECIDGSWANDTCDPLLDSSDEVCDNVDNDCDGTVDEDLSNPTTCGVGACWGNTGAITCIAGSWVNNNCDPLEGAVTEVPDNGVDDDCNPLTYDTPPDVDGDGDGYTEIQGDCDDTNAAVNPGATEIPDNGIDDDCNLITYDSDQDTDDDGDGYAENEGGSGPMMAMSMSSELTSASIEIQGDCDDTNSAIYPGATEILNNGIDDDCNALTYDSDPDTDDDLDGYTENQGDCDDTAPAVNPGVSEIPDNGIDDDCNEATTDDDVDGDGLTNSNDNCREVANSDQLDSNAGEDDNLSVLGEQHYGNKCDPDFDNDGIVGIADFAVFRSCWGVCGGSPEWSDCEDADLDGDGCVGIADFGIFRSYWGYEPGPGF